jgi:hypothetical protein
MPTAGLLQLPGSPLPASPEHAHEVVWTVPPALWLLARRMGESSLVHWLGRAGVEKTWRATPRRSGRRHERQRWQSKRQRRHPSCRRRYRRHQGAIFRPQVGKQISCNLSTPRAPSAYATARHDRPHRHPHKSTRPAPNGERTDASNGQSASSSAGPPTLCAVDRVEAYSLKHMQRRSLQGGELAGQ